MRAQSRSGIGWALGSSRVSTVTSGSYLLRMTRRPQAQSRPRTSTGAVQPAGRRQPRASRSVHGVGEFPLPEGYWPGPPALLPPWSCLPSRWVKVVCQRGPKSGVTVFVHSGKPVAKSSPSRVQGCEEKELDPRASQTRPPTATSGAEPRGSKEADSGRMRSQWGPCAHACVVLKATP